jgi:3-hydroxyisobutyrate dehydrogenase-like beta-hydroxyacid dehydrogenase
MDKRIGIIGLGIMGGAFARNLAAAGWSVIGYDIDPARNAAAKAAGAEIAHSAQALAETASDIIVSLATPQAVLDTAEVIARADAKGRTVIEASTLSLEDKMAFKAILEKAGHTALDCPVSGTGAQAAVKDIVVLASGDSAAIERLEPMLLEVARKVYHLGAYGNGSKMKFVANHLVAVHNAAAAEAMVLAMKAGLDLQQTIEVISAGAGMSRVFQLRAPMMAERKYLPASARGTMFEKDIAVIGDFAAELRCPTPVFDLAASMCRASLAMGLGDEDLAAICEVFAHMAGLSSRPRASA